MIQTIEQVIDAFADAANRHTVIESFDAGGTEYFFNNLNNVEFPHCFFRYVDWNRELTRVTINFELVAVDRVTTDNNYDTDRADGLPAAFNWNKNNVTQIDSTRDLIDGLVSLVKFGDHRGSITIGDGYSATFIGRGLDSTVGWTVPLTISFESALDLTDVPTNS